MLRHARRLVLPAFLLLLVLAPACSSSSSSPGAASTACKSNSDCGSGLSCLPLATFAGADAGCNPSGKACSKTCTSDADCASLGKGFMCFAGCPGAPSTCGATQ